MKLTKKQLITIICVAVVLTVAVTLCLVFLLGGRSGERELFYYNDFTYVIRDDGKIEIVS